MECGDGEYWGVGVEGWGRSIPWEYSERDMDSSHSVKTN